MMAKEIKICLPFYKIAYALCFIVILSLVRGVVYTCEVGIALEPPMAVLAMVFCADTYVQEITGRRSEVWRLYPAKKRVGAIFKRMMIQEIVLLLFSIAGYGMYLLVQRPVPLYGAVKDGGLEAVLFLEYTAAVLVTVIFWGMLSLTVSCISCNMWAGIGCSFILWILTFSTTGEKYLGKWNLFSYTFRNIEDSGDYGWICGKIVCVLFCLVMAGMLPAILRGTNTRTEKKLPQSGSGVDKLW